MPVTIKGLLNAIDSKDLTNVKNILKNNSNLLSEETVIAVLPEKNNLNSKSMSIKGLALHYALFLQDINIIRLIIKTMAKNKTLTQALIYDDAAILKSLFLTLSPKADYNKESSLIITGSKLTLSSLQSVLTKRENDLKAIAKSVFSILMDSIEMDSFTRLFNAAIRYYLDNKCQTENGYAFFPDDIYSVFEEMNSSEHYYYLALCFTHHLMNSEEAIFYYAKTIEAIIDSKNPPNEEQLVRLSKWDVSILEDIRARSGLLKLIPTLYGNYAEIILLLYGPNPNPIEAVKKLEKISHLSQATILLAECYRQGIGVTQNNQTALLHYRKVYEKTLKEDNKLNRSFRKRIVNILIIWKNETKDINLFAEVQTEIARCYYLSNRCEEAKAVLESISTDNLVEKNKEEIQGILAKIYFSLETQTLAKNDSNDYIGKAAEISYGPALYALAIRSENEEDYLTAAKYFLDSFYAKIDPCIKTAIEGTQRCLKHLQGNEANTVRARLVHGIRYKAEADKSETNWSLFKQTLNEISGQGYMPAKYTLAFCYEKGRTFKWINRTSSILEMLKDVPNSENSKYLLALETYATSLHEYANETNDQQTYKKYNEVIACYGRVLLSDIDSSLNKWEKLDCIDAKHYSKENLLIMTRSTQSALSVYVCYAQVYLALAEEDFIKYKQKMQELENNYPSFFVSVTQDLTIATYIKKREEEQEKLNSSIYPSGYILPYNPEVLPLYPNFSKGITSESTNTSDNLPKGSAPIIDQEEVHNDAIDLNQNNSHPTFANFPVPSSVTDCDPPLDITSDNKIPADNIQVTSGLLNSHLNLFIEAYKNLELENQVLKDETEVLKEENELLKMENNKLMVMISSQPNEKTMRLKIQLDSANKKLAAISSIIGPFFKTVHSSQSENITKEKRDMRRKSF